MKKWILKMFFKSEIAKFQQIIMTKQLEIENLKKQIKYLQSDLDLIKMKGKIYHEYLLN